MPKNEPVESSTSEKLDQILGLLGRRWAWILVPAVVVTVGGVAALMTLPNKYTSQTTLAFVQQQISQRYVESPTTMTPLDAVQMMARDVLTRSQLVSIINEFGLYDVKGKAPAGDLIAERMRKDIELIPVEQVLGRPDLGAFHLTFTTDNPSKAQAVTSRLASLFIEQNLKVQEDRVTRTDSFLKEQLEASRLRLAEQEKRLQAFKSQNLGELPEQQQAALSRLSDLRNQLQNIASNLDRAQQQRDQLAATITRDLASLETQRSALLVRFTPKHTEVIKLDQQITRTRALLNHIQNGSPFPADLDGPEIATLKTQADSNATQIENLLKEQRRLTDEMSQLQARVNAMPVREQQLAKLQRDYDLYSNEYTALMNSHLQSQLSTRLEERQEGPQFRVVEPASLPILPSSPNRVKFALGAMAAGFALGLALAFGMEMKDASFHTEEAVRHRYSVPLVLGIPELLTNSERRAKNRKKILSQVAGFALMLVVVAAELYVYRHG